MPRVSLRDPDLTYDEADPPGFRAGSAALGAALGAQDTGATLYELASGQSICPYHYEYGEEEWLLVLEGEPTLRTPEGLEALAPLDLAFFPKGPDGAHEVRNDGAGTVRVLLWSSVVYPTATAYVDSGKVGVYTGREGEDLIARRRDAVGYYADEPPRSG